MNPADVSLSAVNWELDMFVKPEHFLRQERYFDAMVLWALRYATSGFGLVGGGPRVPEGELGTVKHDPTVILAEDTDNLTISVTQCRGLTPAGCMIDVDSKFPIEATFAKSDIKGTAERNVFLVCDPLQKEEVHGRIDDDNPQMKTERRPSYSLSLGISANRIPYGIVVARIRPPKTGVRFEKVPEFIPACVSMASFSELRAGGRKIVEQASALMERYIELNRAVREFLILFKERGIETDADVEALSFVERMVVALQSCVYAILDPVQSPMVFFGHLRRFFHATAVYLDLSPAVQGYYDMLRQTGETEFVSPLQQQRKALDVTPRWEVNDDLAVEMRAASNALGQLRTLERALEGKYIDFRISPMLEAMNFIFDRGGKILYKLAAKPSRVEGLAGELIIHFAQTRLEGRKEYRLILVGEQGANFEKGHQINVGIRINEGVAFQNESPDDICEAVFSGQRNFEFDFKAPDVPVISDLRVSIEAQDPIRTALVFVRHRFFAGQSESSTAQPLIPSNEEVSHPPRTQLDPNISGAPPRRERVADAAPGGEGSMPWRNPPRPDKPREPEDQSQPTPSRRKRIDR